ncbi:RNA-guided pseudouridylation complex pseudouridine synthase subunit Cbf5 [Halobacteriales archaeon SW_6_65_46]|nr:MAG: RNA-guided pseudouridylation complex pseudouridine synthase subunit Cbf5 [Halobacteriales archaeon SW_6_65_46]
MRSSPDRRTPEELLSFGVVNLDKPPGPSAHQVAGWLRDHAGQDRAAHSGTLDPKVTGCLPTLLGTGVRLAQLFDDAVKEYVAVLELHGRTPADLESVIAEFEGEIYQKPPRKSAVSRRLRVREIHELDVIETDERRALLRIRCASGTYIRKLCHDIGLAVGTGAHMGDLRRTATATFDDTTLATIHEFHDAVTEWREHGDETWLREVVQPAERVLRDVPRVTVAESAVPEIAEGAPVYAPGVLASEASEEGTLVACDAPNGSVVCIGTLVGDPAATSGTVVELERVLL